MSTTRFNLRTDKTSTTGEAPIEIIYQISKQRKYCSSGLSIHPGYWDQKTQAAIYAEPKNLRKLYPTLDKSKYLTAKEVEEFNAELRSTKDKISDIEKRYKLDGVPYSISMVIDAFKEKNGKKTKKEAHSDALFDFMDEYITSNSATRKKSSISVYRALRNHLEAYQKHSRKKVTFDNINYQFFETFQNFLISHRSLNNTTVAKQLSTVKTFLNYANARGIEVNGRYKDFKIKKDTLEVIALTNEEFEKLYSIDLSNDRRLSQVRDVFCFSCTTGLRYADLSLLRWEHIKTGEIKINDNKTHKDLVVPLNKYSASILGKYKGKAKPLPVISNQKLNQYLKGWDDLNEMGEVIKHYPGLCEIAGINDPVEIVRRKGAERVANILPKFKLIGVHTGRKTFVTLSLEKGMSAEEVMKITGHSDYKSFKRYVNITKERSKVVMVKAWGGIESKLKVI